MEMQFFAQMKAQHPSPTVRVQALRWRLGNRIWYKPDMVALLETSSGLQLTRWELKGPHAFRGEFKNLKVAASLYPEVRWILAWKEDAQWAYHLVLP